MANTSTCLSPACGITVEGAHKRCPQCGWAMSSARWIRVRGVVLIVCGLILVGLMGTVTFYLWPTLIDPEQAIKKGDFAGTVQEAEMIFLLFAAVIGFGLLALANGIYMIVSGRQNRVFVIISLVVGAALFIAGRAARNGWFG